MATGAANGSRRPQRQFTEEFRTQAARLVLDEGATVGAVARELDLTPSALRQWVERARTDRTGGQTGREMWEMMEENLEHTLAADPYKQMGGYLKRCLGVNLYIKAENPAGSRIQQFFVNGETLEAGRHYTVAFITSQGVPNKYGSARRELPISAIDSLRRYFRNHPKVNADLRGAVVVV